MKTERNPDKENITRSVQIAFRVTPEEKEQIKGYCDAHELKLSDFLRTLCLQATKSL